MNAQNITETDKYFIFIKTWNFLKYYHPEFTSGRVNADSFFLTKQHLVEKIKTQSEMNDMLLRTIQQLGPLNIKAELQQATLKNILKINPVHKWYIENKEVNDDLKKYLLNVYNSRDVKSNYYAPPLNYGSEIPNEKKYEFAASENLPVGIRLLALAKLNGTIDYLYPHKTLMTEDWDTVIKRNISLFKNCSSRKDYEVLILKIVANLNDSHAYNRFYSSLKFKKEIFKNTFYPPFDYKIIDRRILVTGIIVPEVCTQAGINIGDWITEINEQSVSTRIDTLSKLLTASNRNKLISKISEYGTNLIWSADGSDFRMKLQSNGKEKSAFVSFIHLNDQVNTQKINTYFQNKYIKADSLKGFMLLKNNIAYFNIDRIIQLVQQVSEDKLDQHLDSILNLASKQKGIIFDMRGYPQWSGFIYTFLYKKFGSHDQRFAKYFKANLNNIGTFNWLDTASTYHNATVVPEQFKYKGKVMIIVNAETRSLSEWETMDLQSMFPNAKTIGEQTSGGDGDEKYINIPGNYEVHFTGNAIYYPDGTSAQGKGVRINKIIHPSPSAILEGKDTLLNYAIQQVEQ